MCFDENLPPIRRLVLEVEGGGEDADQDDVHEGARDAGPQTGDVLRRVLVPTRGVSNFRLT